METIIENGKKMDGIPYPVAVWDAKSGMWDDSIEELSAIFANSEGEAIDLAKDYMLDSVYASDMDGEEQAEAVEYYSNDGNYIIDSDRHEMRLYVFDEYTDKGGTGEITLYTDKDEAVRAAKKEWRHLCESDKRDYRRDVCGTFRVYEVSIPYSDIIGEGEEAYTEYPYTEYEEWEWYNALKEG